MNEHLKIITWTRFFSLLQICIEHECVYVQINLKYFTFAYYFNIIICK